MRLDKTRPQSSETIALGVVDALAQLSFLIQDTLARIGAEHDSSIVQMRLLGILRDRSPGMNEAADHLNLDKSSVTGLVDRAERRGFVERSPSLTDRRVIDVSITPTGRRIAQRAATAFERHIAALVQPLTKKEYESLSNLAGRIVNLNLTPA